jgi:fatty acid desaturase
MRIAKHYYQPPAWYPWKGALHLGLLVTAVAGSVHSPTMLRWFLIPFASLQIIGLYTLLHGASHGHLARSRRFNDGLGILVSMILGTTLTGYRACHLRHHFHLRQKDDPQEVIHLSPGSRLVMAVHLLIASVIGSLIFIWVRVPIMGARWSSWRRVGTELVLALGFHATFFGLVLPVSARWPLLAAMGLAAVWGSLLDITYHQGLPVSGGYESSRSLDCDRFGFWFLNGENRHAEHHAFPGVPCPRLRVLSTEVRSELEARGTVYELGYLTAFWKGLFLAPSFLPPLSGREMS